MGLDKEKFIASAKAAGYTDDEIKAELGDSSPATVSSDKETAKNEAEFAAKTAKEKQQYEENVGASQKTKFQLGDFSVEMPSSVATPLKAVGEGLLVAGAYQGVKKGAELGKDLYNKVHGSLRDLMSSKEEGLLAAQQAEKSTLAKTEVGKPPKEMPMIERSEYNKEITKAAKEVGSSDVRQFTRDAKGNIQWPEKMSPSGRAGAEAFMQQYPDIAKQLESKNQFAILGAGSGDNSLYNTYGSQIRKDIIQEVNQGKVAGPHGGNEGFYNKTLTPAINAVPPTTTLGSQLERLRIEQPEGGTHGPLGTSVAIKDGKLLKGKNIVPGALKAGGTAALLMAISEAANAAQKGQYGEAAKIGVPAVAGLVNPTAGGLTEAAVNPSEAAQQLRGVAPILGTFAEIANQKAQQYLKKPKGAIQPPK